MKFRSVTPLIPFFLLLLFIAVNMTAQEELSAKLTGPYLDQTPPGDIPEIFAPGIVSTEMYNHSSISISPGLNEIYWAMAPLDAPKRIYCSRYQNGAWTAPEIVSFTRSEDGDCPVLSPDGSRMYFNSNRPIGEGTPRRERIWCVNRVEGKWQQPYPLATVINGSHLHWQVSVDRIGHLYFGSERRGTKGRDDIFFAEYSGGMFQSPISLGEHINSEEHESTPFISPDGDYLIFNRDGLLISFLNREGQWSKAVSMGALYDGICPYVSPDSKYLFFLKMGMGFNDVYWVSAKIIEELKSKNGGGL